MTHDYQRHGTTTLFAALDTLDRSVIGQCLPDTVARSSCGSSARSTASSPIELHLIIDNYRTHKPTT